MEVPNYDYLKNLLKNIYINNYNIKCDTDNIWLDRKYFAMEK